MRKVLITCRSHPDEGAWWKLYCVTSERMRRYAKRHGYEYRDVFYEDFDRAEWPGLFSGRLPLWPFDPALTSPCWQKIPAVITALREYDAVVYLDNDVAVLDFDRDILDDLPSDRWIGMAEGVTDEGKGPNVGVMAIRRNPDSVRFFRDAWETDAWRWAKWTDQGSIMSLLGFTTQPPIVCLGGTEYTPGYHVLGDEWNSWTTIGAPQPGARFYHAAWGRDGQWKLDVVRAAIASREGERHG